MSGAQIEDYGLVGDGRCAALADRDGAISWLCWPRFDSTPCFAGLLGGAQNGHWTMTPAVAFKASRAYRGDTLILATRFETGSGAVELVDFMPYGGEPQSLIRIVKGLRGRVPLAATFAPRCAEARTVPRYTKTRYGLLAQADALALSLSASRPDLCRAEECLSFDIGEGEEIAFVMSEGPESVSDPVSFAHSALADCRRFWSEWAGRCRYDGPWRPQVVRSLITLKALIFAPSGGMVAAPTTSLPEHSGGKRNWDYRWLRDSTFAVPALLHTGYEEEAGAWVKWLVSSIEPDKDRIHPFYGIDGSGNHMEREAPWLSGFAGSRPVRFGNGAEDQLQLGIYGEVQDTLHQWRKTAGQGNDIGWQDQLVALSRLHDIWRKPDAGIWEQRNHHERFTQSGAFAWLAFMRARESAEHFGLQGPVQDWRALSAQIHAEVCRRGFDPHLQAFTRAYGSDSLDASTLLLAMVGFVSADDPRIVGTVQAIRNNLASGPFIHRYDPNRERDGVGGAEGAFLPCSFWLADNLILQNRKDEAAAIFEQLLGANNDLGLISEEYDVTERRLLGNFPQALTHLGLIHTALNLQGNGPVHRRSAAAY